MEATMTYPNNFIDTLLTLSDEMKIKIISILSNSICNRDSIAITKTQKKKLVFPKIPKDFAISEEVSNLGVKFPDNFDYDKVMDEMYNEFAK